MATPANDSFAVPSGVIAGGRNVFFSSGSETGSYNAGTQTWTPGRDAQGVVTRASWELVPTDGTWVEVAGTAFTTQVQPLLSAALPDYNDPGSSDLASVLNAYSGFAHDVQGGRVFANGGGHQDGANNGIYRCDLKKMTWAIAKLPDMPTYWAANYKTNPPRDSTYTIYTNASDAVSANPTTTDYYYDEFYDPIDSRASTRNPTARHTYQGLTFHGGKLRHGVRRYWEWDEATGNWSRQFPCGKNATTNWETGGAHCAECCKATFDEVNNRYYITPANNGAGSGWRYNVNDNTFTQSPTNLIGGYEAYYAAFSRRGRQWCSFTRPDTMGNFWPPKLKMFNLDTMGLTTVDLTGIDQANCVDGFEESTIMAYVDAVDKFLLLMMYDITGTIPDGNLPMEPFWIDPNTGVMTHEVQTGKFPSLNGWSLIKNKFFYIPQISALIMFKDATSNAIVRRF